VIQWYGLTVDINEGKQAEEELLRRSEAYLAEAQRLSHTGSFGWTPSTGELHWSHETFRILEYDPSVKPTIERVLQRIHPDDVPMMRQLLDETSRGERDFDVTHRLLMPDGSVRFVHVLSRVLKDAAGSLEIVGALMDVTENTRLYRDLAEREVKIRRLIWLIMYTKNGNARSGTDARIVKCLLLASAGVPTMSAKLVAPASSTVLARFRSILVPSFQRAPRKPVNASYHAVLTDQHDIIPGSRSMCL
jgi:hypothetical protein